MLGVLILAVVLIPIIIFAIHTSKDHWTPETGETLTKNSPVTSFETERYSRYKFKTTVIFADGFEYISFDTHSEMTGIGTAKISVDGEMKKKILQKAVLKHEELCENSGKV